MAISFIAKTDEYWLKVRLEGGAVISVPYGLKVDSIETKDKREYFKLLEGTDKGKVASVQVRESQSYLTATIRHRPGAMVRFDRKKQTLHVGSRGPFNAFSGGGYNGFTPISTGTYLLAIAAYPSAQTRPGYNAWCRHHNVWFRIGTNTSGSRFLHAGVISDGCVTARRFIYDPTNGKKPPAGFSDLEQGAKIAPGLLGLPLPASPAPCVNWDEVCDDLILCRHNDQSVGTLLVV